MRRRVVGFGGCRTFRRVDERGQAGRWEERETGWMTATAEGVCHASAFIRGRDGRFGGRIGVVPATGQSPRCSYHGLDRQQRLLSCPFTRPRNADDGDDGNGGGGHRRGRRLDRFAPRN